MEEGYAFDYVCFDEYTEWPPTGCDTESAVEALKELAYKLGQTLASLGEYLQQAFSQTAEIIKEAIAEILEGIIPAKRKRFPILKKIAFPLRRIYVHSELIPYYTGGFL